MQIVVSLRAVKGVARSFGGGGGWGVLIKSREVYGICLMFCGIFFVNINNCNRLM